jgi:hypothetical protein
MERKRFDPSFTSRDRTPGFTPKRVPTGLLIAAVAVLTGACEDDAMTPAAEETTFEVRIENVSTAYDFTSSGVFTTPSGSDAPGPLALGQSYDFTFDAGPGSRVSFATMFVQSNDYFYGPNGAGIQVHDGGGMPISGDITDQVFLWDAGSEVNQEPGLGPDQAPRQGGANTGAPDPNNTVRLAGDAFGNLPDVADAIQVTLTHLGGTEFRIRIANVSQANTLLTSDGGMAPILLAPGVWTVGGGTDPLFTVGQADRGLGLEDLAEDGSVSGYGSELDGLTGLTGPIAPGVYAVHNGSSVLFAAGALDRGEGLEALAEDGDPSGLASAVSSRSGVVESGAFNTPEGAGGPAPAFPGEAYVFTVTAMPGDRLSLATMLVQSNDLFFAPAEVGIALFDGGGSPYTGDITGMFLLWDAGTEVNQFPGVGSDQAPRQATADTGETEDGIVRQVNDGYLYPEVNQVIRVTLTPISS